MPFKILDTVVVIADLAAHGVRRGDVGAVVQVYGPEAVEVEFVTASGHTQAVLTLGSNQIRPVGSRDLLAVRQLGAARQLVAAIRLRWNAWPRARTRRVLIGQCAVAGPNPRRWSIAIYGLSCWRTV